ncbi:MAG: formylmethanofuran dehydrogenase subunit C [Candidatus Bathyarchaeota archaeon]|nr:formylmethanofuran dehydrogenase subunit C [Candidatus Bathyarchaeota archaeon]
MITLTPKRKFDAPIQAPCINPDTFQGKKRSEIAKLPLTEGNRNFTLGDLFEIVEDKTESPSITINADVSRVKRIGQGMTSGEIVINSDVGMHTGEKMSGGKITVNGNAGDWTGSEMKGGIIQVNGDAGDYTASPYRGTSTGMKGGQIIVTGNVGTEVGGYMRGGLIKVGGNAGRFLGYHMIDGVIFIEKQTEYRIGACMTGGKIILGGEVEELLPSFTIDGVKPKVKINKETSVQGPFYVFLGDMAEHGTGKLFVNKANNPALKSYEKYL